MATYLLKAADEDMQRWRDAASNEGMKFAAFVRLAVEDRAARRVTLVERPLPPAVIATSGMPRAKVKRKRTELCEHRNPPGTYCHRCD